jgi:hypothetical protein
MKWVILALTVVPGMAWAQNARDPGFGDYVARQFLTEVYSTDALNFIQVAGAARHCGIRSDRWAIGAYQYVLDGVNALADEMFGGLRPESERWAAAQFMSHAYRADSDGYRFSSDFCPHITPGVLDELDVGIASDPAAERAERTGKITPLPMLQQARGK